MSAIPTGGTLQLNGNLTFTGNLEAVRGTTALAGTGNAYTGYTHVTNSSTIRLDANGVIPDTSAVLQYGGTTFNVNGRTETVRGVFVGSSGDTTATLQLGTNGNLTVTNNSMPGGSPTNAGQDYYAKVSGSGNITYAHATNDTAEWDILNTANDFNGTWTVTRGRLRFISDAAVGNTATDLIFNGTPTVSIANGAGTASIQVDNGSNLTLGAGRDITLNAGKEGTMYVWGGTTMTLNGIVTGGGDLRKEDTGTLLLNNASNNYGGSTTIIVGNIQLGANGVLPDTTTVIIGGTSGGNPTLDLNGKTETIAGLNDNSQTNGRVTGNGGTLTVGGSGNYSFGGILQDGTGTLTFTKSGAGTQTLSAANTYSGSTTITSGLLLANNTSGSATGTGGVVINGGKLGGTGSLSGLVTLNTGGMISPGASVESLATGANTWNGGGLFDFEFSSDGTGTAGTDWDLLAITGALDMTGASSGSPITVNLFTMSNATTPGLLSSWNPNVNHTWAGFVTTSGLTAVAGNKFSVVTTGFQNPTNGTFSVVPNGNNLDLVYVAIPEPGSFSMLLFGSVIFWRVRRQWSM